MPRIVNPQVISAFTAEGAATQYQAVTTGTADTQVDCTPAAGDDCLGLAYYAANDGAQVDIVMSGPFIGIASAAIARGALVQIANAAGQLAAITPGVTTATNVVGYALEAAAGAGEEFSVFVNPGYAATT